MSTGERVHELHSRHSSNRQQNKSYYRNINAKPMNAPLEMLLWVKNCLHSSCLQTFPCHATTSREKKKKNKQHNNRFDRPQNATCYIRLFQSPQERLLSNGQCLCHVEWRRGKKISPILFLTKKYYSYYMWMCESKGHLFLSYNQPLESSVFTQQAAGFSNQHASGGTGCQ